MQQDGIGHQINLSMLMISKVFMIKCKYKQMMLPRQHLYLIILLTIYVLLLILFIKERKSSRIKIYFSLENQSGVVEKCQEGNPRGLVEKGFSSILCLHIYIYIIKGKELFPSTTTFALTFSLVNYMIVKFCDHKLLNGPIYYFFSNFSFLINYKTYRQIELFLLLKSLLFPKLSQRDTWCFGARNHEVC